MTLSRETVWGNKMGRNDRSATVHGEGLAEC